MPEFREISGYNCSDKFVYNLSFIGLEQGNANADWRNPGADSGLGNIRTKNNVRAEVLVLTASQTLIIRETPQLIKRFCVILNLWLNEKLKLSGITER
ncbi:hypothetical protein [Leptolyngbya sp. FACHB-711]|uniref:hypothetical protein n=1 Tax=Leptolyngbya sp. FACHB-711 TaxID=2692813 RepID=UPI001685EECD|nr:hypothetical protein [Leptolyngbya sp. FACHB-711]MBD2028267.1 hypothetical protein [Leptolyngbya sp. FACHB-711]